VPGRSKSSSSSPRTFRSIADRRRFSRAPRGGGAAQRRHRTAPTERLLTRTTLAVPRAGSRADWPAVRTAQGRIDRRSTSLFRLDPEGFPITPLGGSPGQSRSIHDWRPRRVARHSWPPTQATTFGSGFCPGGLGNRFTRGSTRRVRGQSSQHRDLATCATPRHRDLATCATPRHRDLVTSRCDTHDTMAL
jgi:hypothetical protein